MYFCHGEMPRRTLAIFKKTSTTLSTCHFHSTEVEYKGGRYVHRSRLVDKENSKFISRGKAPWPGIFASYAQLVIHPAPLLCSHLFVSHQRISVIMQPL